MIPANPFTRLGKRFRGLLPVVVDVETGGFNPTKDALLEIAAVMLTCDEEGFLRPEKTHFTHVLPFPGANIEAASLEVTGIDPYHPFRFAVAESQALLEIFTPINAAIQQAQCERAVLVGHNANFDLSFLQAAARRCQLISPFHQFTTFDTATLAGVALGETVLIRAAYAAGMKFDRAQAHSAIYDAEKTAELFCLIVNRWRAMGGWNRAKG